MRGASFLPLPALVLLTNCWTGIAHGSWPTDPALNLPICARAGGQDGVVGAPDGQGGIVLAWYDGRDPQRPNLYAQRVRADGTLSWQSGGVLVCSEYSSKSEITIISDDQGGAILAWTDARSSSWDVYAQRLDGDGRRLWGPAGTAVCGARFQQTDISLVADGDGGAFFAWADGRDGENLHAFAQHLGADGAARWPSDGVRVAPQATRQLVPEIIRGPEGGALVAWSDASARDLRLQRLDASGQALWMEGVSVREGSSGIASWDVVSDGAGGALAFFDDDRNGLLDLYAQRIDAGAQRRWGARGTLVYDAPGHQQIPRAVTDGDGGAFLTSIRDDRGGGSHSWFLQHVGSDGVGRWQANGVRFTDQQLQGIATFAADGTGVVLAWWDGATSDAYAQRLDASGARKWGQDGMLVSSAPGGQYPSVIVPDGAGGAIVAWEDYRQDVYYGSDVFAQRVPFEARPTAIVRSTDIRVTDGDVHVRWELSGFEGIALNVERRVADGNWAAVGRPAVVGEECSWIDQYVAAGARLGYRLASNGMSWGEVWIDVPVPPPAPPPARFELLGSRPHPARGGILNIAVVILDEGPAILEVFDLAGRRMGTREIPPAPGEATVTFDTRAWQQGVYLARLSQAGRSASARVVVVGR